MIEFFDIAQIDNISLRSPNILFSGQNEALHSKPFTFAEKNKLCPQTSHTNPQRQHTTTSYTLVQ